ncbi:MAG: hypothetical protein HYV07_27310 [Deltaproteobacteria bacterium]|nr:hypothetical protein [Deltaproteobacteria bacterium]
MRRLAALTLVACADQVPSGPSVALSGLCAELARVECDRAAACGLFVGAFDRAACETWFDTVRCRPVVGQLEKALDRGSLSYDGQAARRCVEAVGKTECSGAIRSTLFVDGCGEPLTGLAQPGDACVLGIECAGAAWCNLSLCPGACVAPRALGESCEARSPCEEGLYCSTTGTCLEAVSIGQPCALSLVGNSCKEGSFCDRSGSDPRCVVGGGRGAACARKVDCAKELSCIRATCSGGEDGDSCDEDEDCDDGLVCGSRGRCAIPAAQGASCEGHGACRPGLACTSTAGTSACLLEPAAGTACSPTGAPCHLSECKEASCVAAALDGEACLEPTDCLPERRCNGGRCEPSLPCAL